MSLITESGEHCVLHATMGSGSSRGSISLSSVSMALEGLGWEMEAGAAWEGSACVATVCAGWGKAAGCALVAASGGRVWERCCGVAWEPVSACAMRGASPVDKRFWGRMVKRTPATISTAATVEAVARRRRRMVWASASAAWKTSSRRVRRFSSSCSSGVMVPSL